MNSAYAVDINQDFDKQRIDRNNKEMHELLIQLRSLFERLKELMTENMKYGNSITKLLCPPGQEESTEDSLKELLLKLNEDEKEAYTIYRTLLSYVKSKTPRNKI